MQKPNNTPASSASHNSPPVEGCQPRADGVVINGIPIKLNSILDLPYQPRLKEKAKSFAPSRKFARSFILDANKQKKVS